MLVTYNHKKNMSTPMKKGLLGVAVSKNRIAVLALAGRKRINKLAQDVGIAEAIWELMFSTRIRRRNYQRKDQRELLKNIFILYCRKQVVSQKPINFYFYDLPIKTSSLDKTKPDALEFILFRNLDTISSIVKKIYKPGLVFNIISDGAVFSESGVVSDEEVRSYQSNCLKLISAIGVETVNIYDWRQAWEERKNASELHLPEIVIKKLVQRAEILSCGKSYSVKRLISSKIKFEKMRLKDQVHYKYGFKLTQHAHKSDSLQFCIYPVCPSVEVSASRGFCFIDNFGRIKLLSEVQKRQLLDENEIEPVYIKMFDYPFYYKQK